MEITVTGEKKSRWLTKHNQLDGDGGLAIVVGERHRIVARVGAPHVTHADGGHVVDGLCLHALLVRQVSALERPGDLGLWVACEGDLEGSGLASVEVNGLIVLLVHKNLGRHCSREHGYA